MMSGPATSLHRCSMISTDPVHYKLICKHKLTIQHPRHWVLEAERDMGGSFRHGAMLHALGVGHAAAVPEIKVKVRLRHEGQCDAADEGQVVQDGRQVDAQDGGHLHCAHAHRHDGCHVDRRQHLQLACSTMQTGKHQKSHVQGDLLFLYAHQSKQGGCMLKP